MKTKRIYLLRIMLVSVLFCIQFVTLAIEVSQLHKLRNVRNVVRNMEKQIENVEKQIENVEKQIENVEKQIENHNGSLRSLRSYSVDQEGVGMLNLMMENACVPYAYREFLYQIEEKDVCIDCGANVGLVSDIFLKLGATCYAFEPARGCIKILKHKFYKNNKFKLIPAAVSNKNGEATLVEGFSFDAGANIVNFDADQKTIKYTVKVIRLSDFIKDLLKTTNNIHLLKLDIEGAEFDVLEDLIKTGVYKQIKYIVCETHERFSKELEEKFKYVKQLIEENNVKNIYLDWI